MRWASSTCRVRHGQKGQAIPVIGLMLVALIGMAGLVVDGGQLTMQFRASQNAADAASLAAATQISNGASEAQATTRANLVAQYNQIPVADLTVAYYAASGATTTVAALVTQVIATVTHRFPTLFLPIVGIDSATVSTSATVSITLGAGTCVLCLMNPSASGALTSSGNGGLTVTGGNIEVNSTSPTAMTVSGNGNVTAPSSAVDLVGNYSLSGGGRISPTPTLGAVPAPDPFATLDVPTVTGNQSCCPTTLNPGIYSSISLSGNSSVTMNPGIYAVTGPISLSGNGSLTGHNVLIYLACSTNGALTPCAPGQAGGSLSLSGNGSVDLSAPSYGPYQGMTIFSDRNNTSGITLSGNGSTRLTGTVYALSSTVSLSGNGSNDNINSRFVADRAVISGNGATAINYTQSANYVIPNQLTLVN